MIVDILQYCAAILVIAGAFFCLLAAVGLLRLPDLYTRMHAAAKAGAVGVGFVFLSVILMSFDAAVVLRAGIGVLFILLTTPVSAHLLARAAHVSGLRPTELTIVNDLDEETHG